MEMCDCSLSARILNHWAAQQQQQQPRHSHHQPQQDSDQQQDQRQQQPEPELSWQLVIQLLRQAAAALAFLHRTGSTILHNDVRAANMVLTRTLDRSGPSWKLKICDFGLAVAAGPDGCAQVSGPIGPPAPVTACVLVCILDVFLISARFTLGGGGGGLRILPGSCHAQTNGSST
jgi:serine/threonine protein kinase